MSNRTSTGLSAQLLRILTTEDEEFAARMIKGSSDLLTELRAGLEALKGAARAPAGPDGVRDVIGQRFAIWPARTRTEGQWEAFWADYVDILQDLPRSALEGAMKAWIGNGASRMPYPGELLPLAKTATTPELLALERANRILEVDRPKLAAPKVREKPSREQVEALMDGMRHEMLAKRDPLHLNRMRRAAWMSDAQWHQAQTTGTWS